MNKRTALIAALVVSIGVNLLVAGVFIGRIGWGPPKGPPPGAWAAKNLSQETRRLVRRRMAEHLESVRPMRAELRRVGAGIRAATLAEPFDPDRLKAALEEQREVTDRYQRLLHENLAEVAAELPVEERSALVRAALARGSARASPPGPRRTPDGPRGEGRERPPRPPTPDRG